MAGPFVNQQMAAQQDQREQQQAAQMMQLGYYASLAKQRDEAAQDSWLRGQMNIVNSDLPEQLRATALTNVYHKMGVPDVQVTPEWFTPMASTMNDMITAKNEGRDLSEFLPRLELIMKQPGLIPYSQRNQLPELATAVQDSAARKTAELVVPEIGPVDEAKQRLLRAQDPSESDLQLYGGYDGWRSQNIRDQALVDKDALRSTQRQRTYDMLKLNPSAVPKVLEGALKIGLKPEEVAQSTAMDLMSTVPLEDMDKEQKRYVEAYYRIFKPDQADKMGFETAAGKYTRLTGELEAVQGRWALLGQTSMALEQHATAANQIALDTSLLANGAQVTMPQHEADTLRVKFMEQGQAIKAGKAAFDQQVGPMVQAFGTQAETALSTATMLEKRLLGLSPGDREIVQGKIDESRRIQKSSQAMTRLLTDLSPYAITEKKAQLGLLNTQYEMLKQEAKEGESKASLLDGSALPDQINALRTQVETLERDRTDAQATVQQEQAYLLEKETVTDARLKALGKAKDAEAAVRAAATAAFNDHVQNGTSFDAAAVKYANQYGANVKEVSALTNSFKTHDDAMTLSQAQHAALNSLQAWQRSHPGQDPKAKDLTDIAVRVGKQYPGVKSTDIQDALKDQTRAPIQINMPDEASKEASRDFVKSTRATYDQLKQAPIVLRNIEEAKALIPQSKGFMGPAGDALLNAAKFLNNRLGARIDTEGVKSAEELKSRLFFGIMDNLKKMDSQPSEMQQQMMKEALGNIGNDPNALGRVLDAYGDTVRDKVDLFNQEIASAEKRGTQFPYDPRIQLPGRKSASGEPVVKTDAEYSALPPGTVYVGPDGKRRTKK